MDVAASCMAQGGVSEVPSLMDVFTALVLYFAVVFGP